MSVGEGSIVRLPIVSTTDSASAEATPVQSRIVATSDATSDAPEFDDRLGGGLAVGQN